MFDQILPKRSSRRIFLTGVSIIVPQVSKRSSRRIFLTRRPRNPDTTFDTEVGNHLTKNWSFLDHFLIKFDDKGASKMIKKRSRNDQFPHHKWRQNCSKLSSFLLKTGFAFGQKWIPLWWKWSHFCQKMRNVNVPGGCLIYIFPNEFRCFFIWFRFLTSNFHRRKAQNRFPDSPNWRIRIRKLLIPGSGIAHFRFRKSSILEVARSQKWSDLDLIIVSPRVMPHANWVANLDSFETQLAKNQCPWSFLAWCVQLLWPDCHFQVAQV